jgi:hypothetical protein
MLKASNSFFWPHSIKGDDQFSLPSIQAKFSIQAKVRFFIQLTKNEDCEGSAEYSIWQIWILDEGRLIAAKTVKEKYGIC